MQLEQPRWQICSPKVARTDIRQALSIWMVQKPLPRNQIDDRGRYTAPSER